MQPHASTRSGKIYSRVCARSIPLAQLVQHAAAAEDATMPRVVALSAGGANLHCDQKATIWGRVSSPSYSALSCPSLLSAPCPTCSPRNPPADATVSAHAPSDGFNPTHAHACRCHDATSTADAPHFQPFAHTSEPNARRATSAHERAPRKRSFDSAGFNHASSDADANFSPKRPRQSLADCTSSSLSDLPVGTSTHAGSETHAPSAMHSQTSCKPHTAHNKARKKRHTANRKDRAFEEASYAPLKSTQARFASTSSSVSRPLDLPSLPSNKTGYEALSANLGKEGEFVLEELLRDGWDYLEWDGKESIVIEDSKTGTAVVVCVGRPEDPTYDQACNDAHEALCSAGMDAGPTAAVNPKRGRFPALNAGMCYGHGPPKPYNLQNRGHEGLVQQLLDNPNIQHLAHAQSAALHLYHPKVYQHFHRRALAVRRHCPNFTPNFTRSAFCTCALNLGPEVITHGHRDAMNCAYGFCVVTALGKYDPRKGGHLVIRELRLIIEFPPGAQIIIPSAVFEHGNTGIQRGETRTSFTQYSPGALLRYVDNGFRTEHKYYEEDPEGYADMAARKPLRRKMGLGLWSRTSEILAGTWEYGAGPIDTD